MGFFKKFLAWLSGEVPVESLEVEQAVYGKIIAAGACEFFAETPLGEMRGTWHGSDDVPAGTPIKIVLPPEIFHLDDCPPEENFFRLSDAGTLCIAAAENFSGDPEDCFVWFFPEDAQGFPA